MQSRYTRFVYLYYRKYSGDLGSHIPSSRDPNVLKPHIGQPCSKRSWEHSPVDSGTDRVVNPL